MRLGSSKATDSCRDGWNVRNCLSNHAQVFRIDEMFDKLVIDEMYEIVWIWIFWNWLKLEYEYSRICVVWVVRAKSLCCGKTHVDVVLLVVWVVFVWFVVCYVWLIKLGCIRRRCGMNILNFGLSPLCLVYMKFLMA